MDFDGDSSDAFTGAFQSTGWTDPGMAGGGDHKIERDPSLFSRRVPIPFMEHQLQ